jgi:DnaJ-class molecular chaperone
MEYRKYTVSRTGQNTWDNKYYDVCRNCLGAGLITLLGNMSASTVVQCPVCLGTGDVKVTKKIEVIVEPII